MDISAWVSADVGEAGICLVCLTPDKVNRVREPSGSLFSTAAEQLAIRCLGGDCPTGSSDSGCLSKSVYRR